MPATPHVIVLGASVAGLCTGLPLHRRGLRVTVLDADPAIGETRTDEVARRAPRWSTPQSAHSHAFLARTVQVLREEAPEVLAGLVDAGAELRDLRPPASVRAPHPEPDPDLVTLAARRTTFEGGGIEPRKGSLELVEAIARLRRRYPDVGWVVAGGETLFDHRDYRDYRAAVEARATELDVAPQVLGTVADDTLPALVAAADVVAFPSTYEGFGLVPLEALAAGTPLVVRDIPVLREVVGDAARYGHDPTTLAHALAASLGPRDAQRIARGRAIAAGYRWDVAADAHRRLYERVASRSAVAMVHGGR